MTQIYPLSCLQSIWKEQWTRGLLPALHPSTLLLVETPDFTLGTSATPLDAVSKRQSVKIIHANGWTHGPRVSLRRCPPPRIEFSVVWKQLGHSSQQQSQTRPSVSGSSYLVAQSFLSSPLSPPKFGPVGYTDREFSKDPVDTSCRKVQDI